MATTKKRAFDPNSLILDDGREFQTQQGRPAEFALGLEQIRLRRAAEDQYEQGQRMSDFASPVWKTGGRNINGPAPDMFHDAFYGIMQMKENAANRAGKALTVKPNANSYIPTTAGPGQTALPDSVAALEEFTKQRRRR